MAKAKIPRHETALVARQRATAPPSGIFSKLTTSKPTSINWPSTDPAEDIGGVCVADSFFESAPEKSSPENSVPPDNLLATLTKFRVLPQEIDPETIRFFVPDLRRVAQPYDDRLRRIARAVARALSVQAVTTWLIGNRPSNVTAVRFDLLAELASWALPLVPPKMESVGQLEFELYQHVMNGACRTLDLLLGTLLKWAGPEALVALVSDHGLLLGDSRPVSSPKHLSNADTWRRPEGILVLSGENCRPDDVIFGARLLDVVPTLLAALGVPAPPSLEGRILAEAFTDEWPDPTGEGRPIAWAPQTEAPPDFPVDASAEIIEQNWNLARSLLDGRHIAAALDLLEKLHRSRPDRLDFLHLLFECQLARRKIESARETLELLLDYLWQAPPAALLQARLEYAARRFEVSLRHLETIESLEKPPPRLHLQIGLNLVKLNQSARARDSFVRELEVQPDSAEAHAGLAYCALRAGDFDQTIEQALAAIALNYQLHHAHFLLGLAQARKGEIENAIVAFRMVTALVPEFAPAHRCLSILYSRDPAQPDLAQWHLELARSARNWTWGF